jgi:hypothetical protein
MSTPDINLNRMLNMIYFSKLSRWGIFKLKIKRWFIRLKIRLTLRWRYRNIHKYTVTVPLKGDV